MAAKQQTLTTIARYLFKRAKSAIDPRWFQRLGTTGFFMRGAVPPKRGTYELMQSFRRSPWLRSVAGKISQHVASVEWEVKVPRDGNGNALRLRALQRSGYHARQKLYKTYRRSGMTFEVVDDHPLTELLDQANPAMTGFDAREATQLQLDHSGESFWILQFDPLLGIPVAYWPIPSTWVTRVPDETRPSFDVVVQGMQAEIPMGEMMWLRYRDPANPYGRGVGYAESLADEIDTDEFAATFIKSFFYNRAQPDLLIGMEDTDEEQLELAKLKFEEKHRGHWKAHRAHFFTGKLDIHELSASFKDAEVSQLRSWERDAFRAVFGVPAEILGLTATASRAAVTQARFIMASEVTTPRLEFLRAQMQAYLVPYYDENIVVDYVSPMPDDREMQLQFLAAAPHAATRGEWREAQGLEDRGDIDDVHIVPFNLTAQRPGSVSGRAAALQEAERVLQEIQREFLPLRLPQKSAADRIADLLKPETIVNEVEPLWVSEVEEWGNLALADLGLEPKFNMLNPLVRQHIEAFSSEKITRINETTKAAVRETLSEGVSRGEGIDRLTRRIESVMTDRKDWQAERIARTEVIGSSNFATHTAMATSGAVFEKQWVATLDTDVRDTHLALNGQTVGMNDLFESESGATAQYPGGFGEAAEDINCRCTVAGVVDDPKSKDQLAAVWRRFDNRTQGWITEGRRAFVRAFNEQERELIDAVEAMFGD